MEDNHSAVFADGALCLFHMFAIILIVLRGNLSLSLSPLSVYKCVCVCVLLVSKDLFPDPKNISLVQAIFTMLVWFPFKMVCFDDPVGKGGGVKTESTIKVILHMNKHRHGMIADIHVYKTFCNSVLK